MYGPHTEKVKFCGQNRICRPEDRFIRQILAPCWVDARNSHNNASYNCYTVARLMPNDVARKTYTSRIHTLNISIDGFSPTSNIISILVYVF